MRADVLADFPKKWLAEMADPIEGIPVTPEQYPDAEF
jgi:hypothetical protein